MGNETIAKSKQEPTSERQTWQLLDRMQRDKRLSPRHVSLLLALLSAWQSLGFTEPFRVTRRELMRGGRIASTATYHKSIGELITFDYIDYQPPIIQRREAGCGSCRKWPFQFSRKNQLKRTSNPPEGLYQYAWSQYAWSELMFLLYKNPF